MSGGPQVPSLAAGAAAQVLTQHHTTAEGALTTTRSLVRRVRTLIYDFIEHIFKVFSTVLRAQVLLAQVMI